MRISSTLFFQTGLNSINAQQSDLMHLYQQIGSGQRMVTPADDPLGAAQAINISQSQALNQRFSGNREVAKNNLGIEENTLNSMTTLMQDIKTQLIAAGNGTLSDADRTTLANVLQSAKESMLGLANATDGNGQYLFSGHKGDVEPFSVGADGKVTFKGDEGQRLIQVDQTRQISGSDNGLDVFTRAVSGSPAYVTTATAANGGTGVIGAPTITDPKGGNVGNTFTLAFSMQPIDPTDPASPEALHYQVSVTDPNGDPVGTPSAYTVYDSSTKSLDLPGGGVQIKFSGEPVAGDSFRIEPVSQKPVAGVGPTAPTDLNIFNTFDDIIAALGSPTNGDPAAQAKLANSLATAMQKMDVNYDQILTVRASIGARMNEIDAIGNTGAARGLSYTQQLSTLEDVDYYSATAQLQLRTSALEAAALAFKKIQATSLFNMGRS